MCRRNRALSDGKPCRKTATWGTLGSDFYHRPYAHEVGGVVQAEPMAHTPRRHPGLPGLSLPSGRISLLRERLCGQPHGVLRGFSRTPWSPSKRVSRTTLIPPCGWVLRQSTCKASLPVFSCLIQEPSMPILSTRPFARTSSFFMSNTWYLSEELPQFNTSTFIPVSSSSSLTETLPGIYRTISMIGRKVQALGKKSIVGIIAEYNPFHNGHLYHMKRAVETTGAEAVIVVLSSSFVQRGNLPSLTSGADGNGIV